MIVKRIVANIAAEPTQEMREFYGDLFGLHCVMDHGWIATFAAGDLSPTQISVMREGGSGTPVPAISIEVEDVDDIHVRALAAGYPIEYPLTDEPWGVRRFYIRDPAGTILNVLSHAG